MNHHDFDRNGKVDSRDYYIMNELMNSSDNIQNTNYRSTSSTSSVDSSTIWLIIAMIYFFTWIKGTLGFNVISAPLGLLSGGYLFLRIMMWAYS